jgi:hypothetical protein
LHPRLTSLVRFLQIVNDVIIPCPMGAFRVDEDYRGAAFKVVVVDTGIGSFREEPVLHSPTEGHI